MLEQIVSREERSRGIVRGLLLYGLAGIVGVSSVFGLYGCDRNGGRVKVTKGDNQQDVREVVDLPITHGVEAPVKTLDNQTQEPKKEDKRTKEEMIASLYLDYREKYKTLSREDLASLTTDRDTGYYIIQFKEPTKKEWIQEIEKLGGHNYGGIPENAALIRIDQTKRKDVENLPYVRWVGIYQPAYKLNTDILEIYSSNKSAEETADIVVSFFENPGKTLMEVEKAGGRIIHGGNYARIRVQKNRISEIAKINNVGSIDLFHELVYE